MTAHGRLLAHLILSRLRSDRHLPWQSVVSSVLQEELGHADSIDVQLILSAVPSLHAVTPAQRADFAAFLSAQFLPNTANFQRTAYPFGPDGHSYYRKA